MNQRQKIILAILLARRRRRRIYSRRFWVHPINRDRPNFGKFHTLHKRLLEYPEKFFEYYRMSPESFYELLNAVKEDLKKENTQFRRSISAEEKLAVTLRLVPKLGFRFYSCTQQSEKSRYNVPILKQEWYLLLTVTLIMQGILLTR